MGKLGAKLTVWEQSCTGAGTGSTAASIDADGTVVNPKNPVTLLRDVDGFSFLSVARAAAASLSSRGPAASAFLRKLLKLPATFPGRPTLLTLLDFPFATAYGEFPSVSSVGHRRAVEAKTQSKSEVSTTAAAPTSSDLVVQKVSFYSPRHHEAAKRRAARVLLLS
jgi:hypothetical protein